MFLDDLLVELASGFVVLFLILFLRSLVEAINTRLRLVSHLKRCKQDRGLAFFDPDRERLMIRELTQSNSGPLSQEGLREIYAVIFDLTKREVSRD